MRNQVVRNKLSATDARNLRTLLLLNVFAPEQLGARLRQARDEAGLTQEDLGDLVGISTRQIQNLEAGNSKPYKHLEAIAAATGKPAEWFLRDEEPMALEEERDRRIAELTGEVQELRRDIASLRDLVASFSAQLARA